MIWFDLDNSPHVTFFRLIFKELDNRGIKYLVTARNFAQTKELLELNKINFTLIGDHAGKSKLKKIINLFSRGNQLKNFIKNYQIKLAVSHGSRTQLIASKFLGINSLAIFDYEYTEMKIFDLFSTNLLCPNIIPLERLKKAGFNKKKILRYNGLKEELYISEFKPDLLFRRKLGFSDDDILVIIRPPSFSANYHDRKSENLLIKLIEHFIKNENVKILISNRTELEKKYLKERTKDLNNIHFLDRVYDGLQLLYAADYTVSGGGTMNRESAILGTTTYSIFSGKRPYIDEYLEEIGRMKFINDFDDINQIVVSKQEKQPILLSNNNLFTEITDLIVELVNKK